MLTSQPPSQWSGIANEKQEEAAGCDLEKNSGLWDTQAYSSLILPDRRMPQWWGLSKDSKPERERRSLSFQLHHGAWRFGLFPPVLKQQRDNFNSFLFLLLVMLGIELRTLCVLGNHFTSEPHSQTRAFSFLSFLLPLPSNQVQFLLYNTQFIANDSNLKSIVGFNFFSSVT